MESVNIKNRRKRKKQRMQSGKMQEEIMSFTEAEAFEVMGIEPPEETPPAGGNEPPAEGNEPPVEGNEPPIEGNEPPVEGNEPPAEPPAEGGKTEQTMEERAMWAARRRNWEARERQAIEQAAQTRVDQVIADIFRNQTDPFTGKPIDSEAAYRAFVEARERKAEQEQLQKAGIDPNMLQSMVDKQMAPFKQQMEAAQLNAIREQARAVNARMEAALQGELKKVTAMDPSIKTLEDIKAMPTATKFNEYVQRGLGLEDAFYLANRQAVDERRMAAARAATQEQLAGKGHLNPVTGVPGKNPYQVSQAQIAAYREFMPDATEAEIRAAYEAEQKNRN